MTLHKPEDELPPLGRYVLIHVPDRPWLSATDPEGVHWVVARRAPLSGPRLSYFWVCSSADTFDASEVVAWHELPRE